jgi:hypothetical protein
MAQSLTEVLAESARAAARADELERDRIAWNLPPDAVDETPPLDRDQPDGPKAPEKGDSRR